MKKGWAERFLASNDNQATVVLGDEFDDALRVKLLDVLRQLGATPAGPANRYLAGSQDMEEIDVYVEGRLLRVEAETYVGLSITGPADIVHQIRRLFAM